MCDSYTVVTGMYNNDLYDLFIDYKQAYFSPGVEFTYKWRKYAKNHILHDDKKFSKVWKIFVQDNELFKLTKYQIPRSGFSVIAVSFFFFFYRFLHFYT